MNAAERIASKIRPMIAAKKPFASAWRQNRKRRRPGCEDPDLKGGGGIP